MSEAKRMVLGLFRSRSQAGSSSRDVQNSTTDKVTHRHEPRLTSRDRPARSRSRPKLDKTSLSSIPTTAAQMAEDGRASSNSFTSPPKWPPLGFTSDVEMTLEEATKLITQGVPIYQGLRVPVPYASEGYFALYTTCNSSREGETDVARFYKDAYSVMTFQLQAPGLPSQPWDTLEQPSLAFCFGKRPGTITLNQWASLSGRLKPSMELRDPTVRPRQVAFDTIIDRLIFLQDAGFEVDDEDLMYKDLYKKFLKDPDRFLGPHKAMERQIADLITVLSGPQWIDFSNSRNQIVAKFFADVEYTNYGHYKDFFYQLLFSLELEMRIHSKQHAPTPKQKLLSQLPPCISWDLALARKWRECMSIEKFKENNESKQIRFSLKAKRHQVKALRKFAKALNWPNLADVDEVLRSRDKSAQPLEDRSSDAMSYFTGVILPGVTLPWLLMNSLIDCDKDSGSHLSSLTHMQPHCGFQYRSTTYWSSSCIVGKVLGPTCREVAGWIGPARPAPDLQRIQIARIRQRRPRHQMTPKEVLSMTVRSDPLGPPAKVYPVIEYQQILPDLENIPDLVRVEKLSLKPVPSPVPSSATPMVREEPKSAPVLYDACVQFAIDGKSWPLRLSFDVSYIYAFPCNGGPHPLFYDYIYKAVKVDEILTIENWGGQSQESIANATGRNANASTQNVKVNRDDNDVERVLVVEAFGVPDNEVLARAYCSHWGLSAIVANVHKTCMACAIREAYAACLNVVILVEDGYYVSDA